MSGDVEDRMATRAARAKRSAKGRNNNEDQSCGWDVQLTGPVQVEGTDGDGVLEKIMMGSPR